MSNKINEQDFADFDMAPQPREVELTDRKGEPIGMTVTVVSKYDDRFQKALDQMQRKAAVARQKGRNLSADDQIDNLQRAFIARIDGWTVSGPMKEKVGDLSFNPRNAKTIFFGLGKFSAAIRDQIDRVATELDQGFDDE